MSHMSWEEIDQKRRTLDPTLEAAVEEASLRLDLGQFVYDLRIAAGLTQKQLAERMGTTQSAVARLEGGGMNPSAALLGKLGHALGVEMRLSVSYGDDQKTPAVVLSKAS
jgi:ribosome-binding protein aMBF1 (putative translation factor)